MKIYNVLLGFLGIFSPRDTRGFFRGGIHGNLRDAAGMDGKIRAKYLARTVHEFVFERFTA